MISLLLRFILVNISKRIYLFILMHCVIIIFLVTIVTKRDVELFNIGHELVKSKNTIIIIKTKRKCIKKKEEKKRARKK